MAIGFVCFGFFLRADSAESEFKAGAAKVDITPHEALPMWGYGARHAEPSMGSLDPLFATALVIEAGGEKVAIVGLDLGRSPSESSLQRIRERIQSELGISTSFLAGSHTHHGPVLELSDRRGRGKGRFDAALRYYEQLEDGIVSAIAKADADAVIATLATGAIELDHFNRNRHSKLEPIPCDRTLTVMRLQRADNGASIALLVNFTAHPTSIPAETLKFSSDYVGGLREVVDTELGGVTVFMQGASGDISTDRGPHGDHLAYGRALGKEAVQLARSLQGAEVTSPSLRVREERFTFASRVDFQDPVVRGMYGAAFFPELIMNFVDEYTEGVRPRLTVALLNQQIAFVGVSGEFFCQHAIRLRARARVERLFFFGYNNGYHQYFPTIEGAAEGGYGADAQVAPVEVGAAEQLMDTALIWIYQLQGVLAEDEVPRRIRD
jgi:hypothetical protein